MREEGEMESSSGSMRRVEGDDEGVDEGIC